MPPKTSGHRSGRRLTSMSIKKIQYNGAHKVIKRLCEAVNQMVDQDNGKQDKLTFDTEPVQGSENPVTSSGIYKAISKIVSQIEDGDGVSY